MRAENKPELEYITLAEAAQICRVKRESVRIWIVRGVRVRNLNQPVRLMAHWVGGRWLTTKAWLDEYIAASTKSRIGCMPQSWREERDAAAEKLGGKRKPITN